MPDELAGGASVRQSGEGGRVYRKRKKSETETRRMKAVGGGKMEDLSHIKIVKILEHRRRERQENNNQPRREVVLILKASSEGRKKGQQGKNEQESLVEK